MGTYSDIEEAWWPPPPPPLPCNQARTSGADPSTRSATPTTGGRTAEKAPAHAADHCRPGSAASASTSCPATSRSSLRRQHQQSASALTAQKHHIFQPAHHAAQSPTSRCSSPSRRCCTRSRPASYPPHHCTPAIPRSHPSCTTTQSTPSTRSCSPPSCKARRPGHLQSTEQQTQCYHAPLKQSRNLLGHAGRYSK